MFTSDVDVSLGAYAGKFQPGRNAVGTDVQLSALATAQHAVLADTNELRKARDLDDLGKQRQALIGLPNESIDPPATTTSRATPWTSPWRTSTR